VTPRSRTNQLLYQAELLIDLPAGDDEHAEARRMAVEEGALALTELALESLLREVTEHALLDHHDWRELLGTRGAGIAELHRLRELVARPDSWLAWLVVRLEALHGSDGMARRASGASQGLIAVGSGAALADELRWCLKEAKAEVAALRETSEEW
jgi:D-serine deaminase-like pyridoxal phosphate-dependent protein